MLDLFLVAETFARSASCHGRLTAPMARRTIALPRLGVDRMTTTFAGLTPDANRHLMIGPAYRIAHTRCFLNTFVGFVQGEGTIARGSRLGSKSGLWRTSTMKSPGSPPFELRYARPGTRSFWPSRVSGGTFTKILVWTESMSTLPSHAWHLRRRKSRPSLHRVQTSWSFQIVNVRSSPVGIRSG